MEPTSRIRQASTFQARAAQAAASPASGVQASVAQATAQAVSVQEAQVREPLKARVVTHSLGVRLGGFGVDYTSRRVMVDPGSPQDGAQAAAKALAESAARRAGGERVFEAAWQDPAPEPSVEPDHPDPAWRRGLRAYARAGNLLLPGAGARRASLAVA